jgi:hypothetical protein
MFSSFSPSMIMSHLLLLHIGGGVVSSRNFKSRCSPQAVEEEEEEEEEE